MSYILLYFRQCFSVFRQCCLMTNILYTSLFLGNGGLFRVPANEIYRDPKTRAAIIRVSRFSPLSSTCHKSKIPIFIIWWQLFFPTRKCRFASTFQPLQDMRAERNRQVNTLDVKVNSFKVRLVEEKRSSSRSFKVSHPVFLTNPRGKCYRV